MYFLIDSADQSVLAAKSNGQAARGLLDKLNIKVEQGADPVALANIHAGDRFSIVNLAGAFDSIANSDDQAAQEFAEQFKEAVNKFYEK
jgi:hypothetical protein